MKRSKKLELNLNFENQFYSQFLPPRKVLKSPARFHGQEGGAEKSTYKAGPKIVPSHFLSRPGSYINNPLITFFDYSNPKISLSVTINFYIVSLIACILVFTPWVNIQFRRKWHNICLKQLISRHGCTKMFKMTVFKLQIGGCGTISRIIKLRLKVNFIF